MTSGRVHTIRLRAAWRSLGDGRWARRFQRPTGLTGGHRVWLVLGPGVSSVELNGVATPVDAGRCDLTERIAATNEIIVAPPDEESLAEVRLEIEEPPAPPAG